MATMQRSIEATTQVRALLEHARAALVEDPGTVLAGACSPEQRRSRTFLATLSVGIGGGASLQQQVAIEAGRARAADGSVALPIRWHATGHGRLAPSFEGELVLAGGALGTDVTLRGSYAVPLGPIGRFGDGLAGRRVARRSIAGYLEALARRLDSEVDRRVDSVRWHPAPYAVALQEDDCRSEHFIG